MARMKDKQLLEMAKPSGDYDLACYVVMWKGEYVKKNLVRELEPFFKNAALADPDYDFKDLVPRYVENIGLVGGPKGYLPGPGAKLYGLPYGAETSILAYRRDVFAKLNLKPPETYAESREAAAGAEGEGRHGRADLARPGRPPVRARLAAAPEPAGRQGLRRQVEAALQRRRSACKAMKLLKLVSDTGPVGIPGYGQGEMITSLPAGPGRDVPGLVADLRPGERPGQVQDRRARSATCVHPKGVRYSSQSGGLGLAIPKNAKNPDAAFLLLQWLTSKAQDKAVAKVGGVPTRNSTLDRPARWCASTPSTSRCASSSSTPTPTGGPIIAEWDEINIQALGVAVSEALTGKKTPEDALNGMVPKVTDIMKRGGYLKA